MELTYHGHSCFKLKGTAGTVVTDPFQEYVGFSLPSLSADVVTISHHHPDHDAADKVKPSSKRDKPFVIDHNGEYEVAGISVFGTKTFHDGSEGSERGENLVFTILLDGVRVCHLGDLGHELSADQVSQIGAVDILLCPVGGTFTIDPKQAVKVIHAIEPGIVIPMHYNTPQHDQKVFGDVSPLSEFLQAYGQEVTPVDKLKADKARIPEETELVVLMHP